MGVGSTTIIGEHPVRGTSSRRFRRPGVTSRNLKEYSSAGGVHLARTARPVVSPWVGLAGWHCQGKHRSREPIKPARRPAEARQVPFRRHHLVQERPRPGDGRARPPRRGASPAAGVPFDTWVGRRMDQRLRRLPGSSESTQQPTRRRIEGVVMSPRWIPGSPSSGRSPQAFHPHRRQVSR